MKTQKPDEKVLKKMKREYDDFDFANEPRRAKAKKPRRGVKIFTDDNNELDYYSNED